MNNIIPWEYVQLRIAVAERQRCLKMAYAQYRKSGSVDNETQARCQRSDAMLTKAFEEFK